MPDKSVTPGIGIDGSVGRARTECKIKLDTKLSDAFQSTESEVEALTESAFQSAAEILTSQPVVVKDDELPGLIHASCEGEFSKVNKWLDRRLAEIKKHWKRVLLVPHSRPTDVKLRRRYYEAAELKTKKRLSWARLARTFDPEGYKRNQRAALDRFRKGIKSLEKGNRLTPKEKRLLTIAVFFAPTELSDPALSPPDPKWPEKKLKEVTDTYLYLGERVGWTFREMLLDIVELYLLVAERALPGSGARTLFNDAWKMYVADTLPEMTASEAEQILGPPEARENLEDRLVLRYKSASIQFKNGRFHQVRATGKKPPSLSSTE